MTGSLAVKKGRYYAIINTYKNGKRKKVWIATGLSQKGNKRKAEQFLRQKIAEFEQNEGIVNDDILFSDYIRIWLKGVSRKVDEVTMQGYQITADTQILPYFDALETKLVDVDHKMLQKYIDDKYDHGRRDGKGGLSPKSLRHHKNVMSQVLDVAVKEKSIASNPFQFVDLPPLVRFESSFYNADQLKALFKALEDDPLYPIVKITALYGLRRSELLGLKWSSIDFTSKTMIIRHTRCGVTKTVAKDKTKNESSRRVFPLTDEALEIFKKSKGKRLCTANKAVAPMLKMITFSNGLMVDRILPTM